MFNNCEECGGHGYDPRTMIECPYCDGTGDVNNEEE